MSENKIMYEVTGAGYMHQKITPVEIEKETHSSVWVDGRRRAKISDYAAYFTTFQMAHNYLAGIASEGVRVAEERLEYARAKLAAAMQVKESGK
jgi:hypothetical protein